MKVSLHESRQCRVAFNGNYAEQLVKLGLLQPSIDRAIIKWERRQTPATGTLHAASVTFPASHLALSCPVGSPRKLISLFDVPLGKALEFGFFFSRDPMDNLEKRFVRANSHPLIYSDMENGESVSTVVRVVDFDPTSLPTPEQLSNKDVTVVGWGLPTAADQTGKNFTTLLWNDPNESGGLLRIMELGGVSITRNK